MSETTHTPYRPSVQGVWRHRHWPLEETGRFVDHAHALPNRTHEHLAQRLGRVQLSWAEKGAAAYPAFVDADRDERLWAGEFRLTALLMLGLIAAIAVAEIVL